MACALDSVLNNTNVAHIEGGEVSGSVDELIRHSISKICQYHFVTNVNAKKRLIQMGEKSENIFIIGSPDVDIILSNKQPHICQVKSKYNINFQSYSIAILHPITTDTKNLKLYSKIFFNSLKESKNNYVVIFPNNDSGSETIIREIKKLKNNKNFRIIPSMRFEYFLSLLKNSNFIIGNSSSGIMEAPYYGIKTINVGNRQHNRFNNESIFNVNFNKKDIIKNINKKIKTFKKKKEFGYGNSDKLFFKKLNLKKIWQSNVQKYFKDLNLVF
jgi:UDP-N-acetylglucosamine 2-epimerase (hydrolysing)